MTTFTVSVSEELKKRMDEFKEVNWPEYLKKRFEVKIKQLQKFQELVNKGEIK